MTDLKKAPVVTPRDLANAKALAEWAELQRRAASAVGLACDAWARVTGGTCFAEINGTDITIRTLFPAAGNGSAKEPAKRSAPT